MTVYRTAATVEPEKPRLFPLEKILTVSARDYCESVERRLSDYRLVGVHAEEDYLSEFQKKVPRETEVVVEYVYASKGNCGRISGTALIPKPKEESTDTSGSVSRSS